MRIFTGLVVMVVGVANVVVGMAANSKFKEVRGGQQRRLERSDSKSNTPPSYITNNLPLVASLIADARSRREGGP